jgi:hypothetical protein
VGVTADDIIEKIDNNVALKIIIQKLPFGDILSTLLSHKSGEIQHKRLTAFLQSLNDKINTLQADNEILISKMKEKADNEDFYFLFLNTAQKAVMSHKTDKISLFANLLKNSLIKDISMEDYLIEVFLNITNDLSINEINNLSKLQSNSLELFYNHRKKIFDLERMKQDILDQKLRIDFPQIPKEYEYDDLFLFSYKGLENCDLVVIKTVQEYGSQTSASYQNSNGLINKVMFNYSRKDEVQLTDFGKKYIDWLIN